MTGDAVEAAAARGDKWASGSIDAVHSPAHRPAKPREPVSRDLPQAAVIEILEFGIKTGDTAAASIIAPDEVRINGMPVLVEAGSIKIGSLGAADAAMVTMTLFARRIVVAAEGDVYDL